MRRFIQNYTLVASAVMGAWLLGWSYVGDVSGIAPHINSINTNHALLHAWVNAITDVELTGTEFIRNPRSVYSGEGDPGGQNVFKTEVISAKSPRPMRTSRFGAYFYSQEGRRGCAEVHTNEEDFRQDPKFSIAYRTCWKFDGPPNFYSMSQQDLDRFARVAPVLRHFIDMKINTVFKGDGQVRYAGSNVFDSHFAQMMIAPNKFAALDADIKAQLALIHLWNIRDQGIVRTRQITGTFGLTLFLVSFGILLTLILMLTKAAKAFEHPRRNAFCAYFVGRSVTSVREESERIRSKREACERELIGLRQQAMRIDADLQGDLSDVLQTEDVDEIRKALAQAQQRQTQRDDESAAAQKTADARRAFLAQVQKLNIAASIERIMNTYDAGRRDAAREMLEKEIELMKRKAELDAFRDSASRCTDLSTKTRVNSLVDGAVDKLGVSPREWRIATHEIRSQLGS